MKRQYIYNRKMHFIILLALLSAFFEATTLASVYAFLNSWETGFFSVINFQLAYSQLVFALIIFVTLSAIFRITNIYYQNKFLQETRAELSTNITNVIKVKKYSTRGSESAADLLSSSINEVELFVNYWLLPVVNLCVNTIALLMIVVFLAVLDIYMLMTVVFIVGGFYAFLYFVIKGHQKTLGVIRHKANKKRYEIGSSIFHLASELFVNNTSDDVIAIYRNENIKLSHATATFLTLAQAPRVVIELIILLSLIVFLSVIGKDDAGNILPVLVSFLFAGYRALPYAQGIYNSMNSLNYSEASSNSLAALLVGEEQPEEYSYGNKLQYPLSIVAEGSNKFGFTGRVEIILHPGDITHIKGDSGVGKSLLLESLLGISKAYDVVVKDCNNNVIGLEDFRKNAAYLRQGSILFEGSVTENVLWFGSENNTVQNNLLQSVGFPSDRKNIQVASLSGGQKQRLLIARTLYVERDLLILDEPFIGLDNSAIEEILNCIKKIFPEKILLLTHHGMLNQANKEMVILRDNL